MSSMEQHFYLPILKFKQGEIFALRDLNEDSANHVYPLFEIMPVPWDYINDAPGKTVLEHVSKVISTIEKNWKRRRFMLDFPYITDEQCCEMPPHPLLKLAEEAKAANLEMVPVINLAGPKCLHDAAREAVKTLGHGVALRIGGEDFDNPMFDVDVEDLLKLLGGIKPSDVDVVVDLGSIPSDGLTPLIVGMRNLLGMLPFMKAWRSVTVAATSFPQTLSEIPSGRGKRIPRGEWTLWTGMLAAKRLIREPNFGDYTVTHPQPFEMDPRLMQVGAKIKYTTEEDWIILKGRGIRSNGFEQYRELAQTITEMADYCGKEFSWGDEYIASCAAGEEKTGNSTTWVRVGVNHHIELVVDQLAKRPGS